MSEGRDRPISSRWRSALTGLAWLGGLALFYLVLKYVVPHFVPFLVALALAVLIDPTVNGLEERLHLSRGVAVAVAMVFFLGLVLGLALFAVGAVVVQLGQLAIDLPAQYDRLVRFSESLLAQLTTVFRGLPADFVTLTEATIRSSLSSVYAGLQALVRAILGGLARLPSVLLIGVVSLVGAFFFSRDKRLIGGFLLSLLPVGYRERVTRVNRDVVSSAVGLIKAQLTLVAITLVIIVAGLYLLGVQYAWLVGLTAGLLDVLPVVGPATVLGPWAIYCLLDGNPGLGVGLIVLVGVITVFRQIMEPRLVGQRIGLHPLLTLVALYLGLRLLGAVGLVVGPLVAIVIKAVIRSGRAVSVSPRPQRRRAPVLAAGGSVSGDRTSGDSPPAGSEPPSDRGSFA